jgi:hypothetical protein
MGSTGSGSFSDYQGYKPSNPDGNGGSSGTDQCARAFSTSLDEVATCDFFKTTGNVPVKGTNVVILFEKRLVAVDPKGVFLGYLPTKFNYLRSCMTDGYSYAGVVQNSSTTPIPAISIDIAPEK